MAETHTSRRIALINQKGGVGKTTTTVNLGVALSQRGLRVLLIDLDPQGHMSLHVGLGDEEPKKTLYDLLTDPDVRADQVIEQLNPNLGVLPGDVNLAGLESELADKVASGQAQSILRDQCADLCSHFDYVLVDCPPSLGLLTVNALVLAREVIVPMQSHFLALQGLSQLLETVQQVRNHLNAHLTVAGMILCMHEGNTILANEVIADLNTFLEQSRDHDVPWSRAVVFDPPVRRNIKLAESPGFGMSIFDYAPYCPGARDYERLAEALVQQQPSASESA